MRREAGSREEKGGWMVAGEERGRQADSPSGLRGGCGEDESRRRWWRRRTLVTCHGRRSQTRLIDRRRKENISFGLVV
jgi:hypothetical protein